MTALAIVIAICIVIALGLFFWSKQRAASRRAAIRQYAEGHNFTSSETACPQT